MLRTLASLTVALGCLMVLPARAGSLVQAIRVEEQGNGTVIRLALTAATRYHIIRLDNPDRLVVDLDDAQLSRAVVMPRTGRAILAVRTGRRSKTTQRIVFDLGGPARVREEMRDLASGGVELALALNGAIATPQNSPAPTAAPGPQPAPRLVAVKAAHQPAAFSRDIIVAVDAGHGGKDPGAIGPSGVREKDVVLAIARELVARINREPGMRAMLTRDSDKYISHRERMRRARQARADLFISVHADSIRNSAVSGSSVYVLSERGATDEAARWLAERENAADLKGGVSLDDKDDMLAQVLLDLSQTASISQSMTAANHVLESLGDVGEVRKRHVQQAGFLVLKSPDMPSLLVETAYISNRGDERRLRDNGHQKRLAEALFTGLQNFFIANPPDGTQLARNAGTVAAATSGTL
ncbi:MAG: N-acetylmuramoyl-L-alanine amidase [Steroidobacteraceae bacterium]